MMTELDKMRERLTKMILMNAELQRENEELKQTVKRVSEALQ